MDVGQKVDRVGRQGLTNKELVSREIADLIFRESGGSGRSPYKIGAERHADFAWRPKKQGLLSFMSGF
jgi:hypothetical protein